MKARTGTPNQPEDVTAPEAVAAAARPLELDLIVRTRSGGRDGDHPTLELRRETSPEKGERFAGRPSAIRGSAEGREQANTFEAGDLHHGPPRLRSTSSENARHSESPRRRR